MAEESIKLIEIQIAKLDFKPGQILAIFAPKDWTVKQTAMFSGWLSQNAKSPHDPLHGVKFLVFPHDFELEIVSPPEGFGF